MSDEPEVSIQQPNDSNGNDRSLVNNGLMVGVGFTMMVAFLFLIYASVYVHMENQEVVTLLTGIITGSVGTIVAFYFGSSRASERKTDVIVKRMNKDG